MTCAPISLPGRTVIFDYGEVISLAPSAADRAVIVGLAGAGRDSEPFWRAYFAHRDGLDQGSAGVAGYWQPIAGDIGARWDQPPVHRRDRAARVPHRTVLSGPPVTGGKGCFRGNAEPGPRCRVPGTVLAWTSASGGGTGMSNGIPAGDAGDQRDREPDLSATDEFAKMREVMRASEKHREGGVDPELQDADADPGPGA